MDRKLKTYTSVLTALTLALLCGTASTARASAIVLNQWYTFDFGGIGSSFTSGATLGVDPPSLAAPTPAWTFTLPGNGTLIVVDGFVSGDQFNVTNFGVSLGDTSVPAAVFTADCSNDITVCLGNPGMSKADFALTAGSYSIDGTAIASPLGGGAAFFEVAVPEPASLSLFATGIVGLVFLRRRKRVLSRS